MKKYSKLFAVLAIAAVMTTSLCACSNNSTSSQAASSAAQESSAAASSSSEEVKNDAKPSDITSKIMNDLGIKFPGMVEVKSDRLDQYYDVTADDIEEFSAYFCGSGAYPDEVAIFKMKSADKVDAAKAALEKRVETQTKTYEDYKPDEMYKIDGNNVIVKGNYVAIIICSDNSKAISELENNIG